MALQIRKSLLVQLTSYFSILSVLTIGIVAIAAYIQAKQGITRSIIDRLTVATALKSSELKQWVDNQIQDVLLSSQQPTIRENLVTLLTTDTSESTYQQAELAIGEYLNHWTSIKSNTRDMRITTNASYIVFDLQNPAFKGRYRPNGNPATFFTPDIANTVVPNFYISPKTGKAAITFATPIFDTENIPMGAIAVDLRLGNIDAIIRNNTGLGKTAETYLVGRGKKGPIFISAERKNEKTSDREISSLGIDRAIEGQSGYGLYKNYAGVPVVGVYRWLPDQNLALLAEISQQEAFAPARQLARNIILIGLLSAGVLLIVVYLLSRQIVRPIVTISRAAESLAAGDLNQTVPVMTENEVGLLAQTFNQMATQLKALVEDLEKRVQE
ncbi:MAG: HAMP domain-containing protein, partial [Okeania sp. SIO2D1]|nr:HAMP domain-containing protein [Okeania sp. SIO2D1]